MVKADGEGPVADKIAICHWSNSGQWNIITVSSSALEGHDNHRFDIWPPVDGMTDGKNWGRGENVYVNGCQTTDIDNVLPSPEPTLTASPSPTVSVTPTPEPTVTVTATATATATPPIQPTPEPCPPAVTDAAVIFPVTALLLATAAWGLRRGR